MLSKLIYKQDIRNYGSKNAGATNALRVYGVKFGLATFLIDFLKGLLCAYLGFKFFGSLGILVCGLLCVIGHILPVIYNFKGGKGIATSFGVLLFAQPLQILFLLILFLIVVLITKYVSLGSIIGLFDMTDESVLCKGLVERIGIEGSKLTHKVNGEKLVVEEPMKDHTEAINHVFDALLDEKYGVIKSLDEVSAIGHRVLHGGDKLTESCIIDEKVKDKIREFIKFGPPNNAS